jgi:hypothetical protein
MRDTQFVWVRLELLRSSLVDHYTIYVNEATSDDLVSSSIGTVYYKPPVRCTELPPPIADPLMLIIMRGGGVKDIGDTQPVNRINNAMGTIVWLYTVKLNRAQLLSIMESESWKQNSTKKESRAMQKALDQLAEESTQALN